MFRKLLVLLLSLLMPLGLAQDSLSMQLFRTIVQQQSGRNIVFSPAGIVRSLERLKEGTAGITAQELQKLNLGTPFSATGSNISPKLSEATFADDTVALQPGIGQVQRVPLSADRQKAVSAINNWCNMATQGCIPELLSTEDITPNSRLLVLNAIYLAEPWQYAFSPEATQQHDFTRSDGSSIRVAMMNSGETEFSAAGGKNWRAVALPYSKAETSEKAFYFIAILPRLDARGFASHLTQQKLDIILRKLAEDNEDESITSTVLLPRFSTQGNICDLTPALKAIGLSNIFTTEADFSPWSSTPGLRLGAVCQKACIEVSERGTKAAAATYADMDEEGESPLEKIIFDRPFLWLISELKPGSTPLFMGVWEGNE